MSAMASTAAREATWRCPRCKRAFTRRGQQHSCRTVSLEEHFERKEASRSFFDHLLNEVTSEVGRCEVVSLPCCIHLHGEHDFLAVLPKKDRLEIRFTLLRELKNPRVRRSAQISKTSYKHSVDIYAPEEIDEEFLGWLREAYHLRDG